MNISTVTEEYEAGNFIPLPVLVVYITFGTVGIFGNGLVLYVIAKVKELQDTTNLFIANQSLIDGMSSIFLIAIFVVPKPPLPEDNLILARFLCGFWYSQFPYWSLLISTLVNLMILTLERYFAVVFPIRYRRYNSYKLVVGCSLIPWASGFLHQTYLITLTRVEGQTCLLYVWPNKSMQPAMGIYTFVISFVVAFAVMFFYYIRIWQTLRQGPTKEDSSVHQASNLRHRARKNVLKTMVSLSLCYAVCWAPNQFTYLLYCVGVGIDLTGTFYFVTVCISFINIWINPFIYTFQYHKFQHGLKTIFGCSRNHPDTRVNTLGIAAPVHASSAPAPVSTVMVASI
nr:G-protein coupled receptor 54-like [Lytechinus pictus]